VSDLHTKMVERLPGIKKPRKNFRGFVYLKSQF